MFDYDLFYDLKTVDLKSVDLKSFANSSIDFLSIDKQISKFWTMAHCKNADFFAFEEKLYWVYGYYFENFPLEMKIARKLNNNLAHRTVRLKKRIQFMLDNYDCLFCTFTFRDDVLNSTSAETRRRYLTRSLRELDCYCVANIDFGSKNGREHYHAIVACSNIDNFGMKFWTYGALNFERINYSDSASTATSKYLIKLTSHAVKGTTDSFNSSIIYIKLKKNKKSLQK